MALCRTPVLYYVLYLAFINLDIYYCNVYFAEDPLDCVTLEQDPLELPCLYLLASSVGYCYITHPGCTC